MLKFIKAVILFILLTSQNSFSQTDANSIIERIDENLSFTSSYIKFKMINVKEKEERVFLLEIKSKKDKGAIIEFMTPEREKGKKILARGDSLWMFVPGVSRAVRLSLKESFMGTAMSNYDLTDYDLHNDYESKIISEKKYKEKDVYVIELKKTRKTIAYDKIIVYVDKKLILPVYMEFYTISGNKIKEMDFDEIKEIGGKLRPTVMIMRDLLDKTLSTKVILLELKQKNFSDDIFSPQKLVE